MVGLKRRNASCRASLNLKTMLEAGTFPPKKEVPYFHHTINLELSLFVKHTIAPLKHLAKQILLYRSFIGVISLHILPTTSHMFLKVRFIDTTTKLHGKMIRASLKPGAKAKPDFR